MEPSGKGWAAFFEKNTMAVRTNIFTFKESELREAALPINAVIRSAREYVALDQTVCVDLFCSYSEPPAAEIAEMKTHNLCAAVNGSYMEGEFVAYVCPLYLPDGNIGGLFAII